MGKMNLITVNGIKNKIYTIQGKQVILDTDLAEFYGVTVKRLNEQVKRNKKKFPGYYIFQLTHNETNFLRSQFATANISSKSRTFPYVFTEYGVSQAASILNSNVAIEMSIKIIDAFIGMRKFLSKQGQIFNRLDFIEQKQIEYDKNFEKVFNALERTEEIKQGIFFDGQIFDAYKFVLKLMRMAKQHLIIIDNYIDESVLTMCAELKKDVELTIFTGNLSKKQTLDIEKYNSQHPFINIKETDKFHDRFIIIDNKEVYHIGASLKDLGKKCFAFSKIEDNSIVESLLKKILL